MPSNWSAIDNNFPSFTGEESPQQQIQALHNYLFQLREGLKYSMRNLTAENFNQAALEQMSDEQKSSMEQLLSGVYNQLNQLSAALGRIGLRVESLETLPDRVTKTEESVAWLTKQAGDAEQDTGALKREMAKVQQELSSHDKRVEELEEALPELQQSAQNLELLEDAVLGTGGIQEQTEATRAQMERISEKVQVAEDGSATIGTVDKPLHLVGQVYINGVLFEQGVTT